MVVIKAELNFRDKFNVNDVANNVKNFISNDLNNALFITHYPDTPYVKHNGNIQVIVMFKMHIDGANDEIKQEIKHDMKAKFKKQLSSQEIQVNVSEYE